MLTFSLNLTKVLQELKEQKIDLYAFVNELCDRIEENESYVHALVPEQNRRERLLKDAVQLEKRFPDKEKRPPLFGLPVGVKDNIRVDGFPTKAGSQLPEQLFSGDEAACVTLLKEAGALIIGKTAMTEFAFFEPASTTNPHNVEHTPGGSSSGSAAGVAAGFFALALGTQTIGSVIRPAAFCGVVGFKPTFDRISTNGSIYFSRSVDHIGLFSQDLEGMKIAASVVCQDWDEKKASTAKTIPVIGVPEGPYLGQMSLESLVQFESNVTDLERSGYTVKRVPVFEEIDVINRLQRELTLYELAKEHSEWIIEYGPLYSPFTSESIATGKQISASTVAKAKDMARNLRSDLHNIMDENGIDIWVCPSALGTAPKGLHTTGDPVMNVPWTFTGMPAINIPVGTGEYNLPLGLQFVARYGDDERLLACTEGMKWVK
ncbi:amidase [bacterium LRH843]|nr:amidase [bacterium LRH843]